jgi:large subunit ribosomal protein L30
MAPAKAAAEAGAVPSKATQAGAAPAKAAPARAAAGKAAAGKAAPANPAAASSATKRSAPAAEATVQLKQVRSAIGSKPKHRGTLRALGLGRIGRTAVLPDRPEVRGMLARVGHLVEIRTEAGGAEK